MITMKYTALVTVAALILTFMLSVRVGRLRARLGVDAPAMSGAPLFDRVFRIHTNTVEQLVLFVPLLWLATSVLGDPIAAGVGAVWIVGRVVYANAYATDPARRAPGMAITLVSTGVLGLATLWGILRSFTA